VDGQIRSIREAGRDPEQWLVRIENAHPGYISWESFLKNQKKMQDNLTRRAARGAPREGAALLQGLVICGRCGRQMQMAYSGKDLKLWYYTCKGDSDKGGKTCWLAPGQQIDEAVERLWLQTVVPAELELSLAVQHEVDERADALESNGSYVCSKSSTKRVWPKGVTRP
jgi:hypothetical protein